MAGTPDDGRPDAVVAGGNETARRKQYQSEDDDALATEPVRSHAEGNLQNALGEPVDTQRQAHQCLAVAAVQMRGGMHGEHRKHQEQAQHAQSEQGSQREAGTDFQRIHPVGGQRGHDCMVHC